jgi:hypothetical protein
MSLGGNTERTTVDAKPVDPLLEPDTCFHAKWRKGIHLDQDVFILILAGLVLLIVILVGITAITAITDDLYDGMDEDQSETRKGAEQRSAWSSGTLDLVDDDQQAQIRPILEDEQCRIFGLRPDSSLSPQEAARLKVGGICQTPITPGYCT